MPYYHYTSREAAQDIICSAKIKPGRNGLLYLTQDRHSQGYEAANILAILGKPVEIRFEIPENEVDTHLPVPRPSPGRVPPERDVLTGELLRKGGGLEVTIGVSLEIHNPPVSWEPLQEP